MFCSSIRYVLNLSSDMDCVNLASQDVLRAYIREIDQKGLLNEVPTDPQLPSPPVVTNTERWLESVHTGQSVSTDDIPPSLESLNTSTDDGSAKEMVIREDNMKFPQSMKLERPKPETRRDGISQRKLSVFVPFPEILRVSD